MKPEELEQIPLQVEKLFYDLQNRVMADVVRRIQKTGEITSTADYQIEKMIMMGQSSEFVENEIKRLTGKTDAEIWKLYDDVVNKDYTRNKSIYDQVNVNFIPFEKNKIMQQWVSAVVAQTKDDIKNITQSMGFALKYGSKTVFTPFSEYYQKYLDRACMDIVTGTFSYDTVLKRVVKEMTASGIRSVDYASGYSNRVTVASRRAVMTGVNQLCGQINQMNAESLGTDTYEVTWHSGARPSHWWGGMVFTMKELEETCGLGKVDGLCGANCYHSYYAFIPGVSVRTYTDEQLAEMNAREKIEREWQGKKYNAYDATQKQRQMETLMRKQRSDIKLLKDGKASQDEIMAAQSRYMKTLHEYQGFSKKMNLPEQMQRVYMDGLGRAAPGRISRKMIAKASSIDNLFEKSKLSKVMGIGKDKIDFSKVDEKSKKSVYNGIKKVFDKFPQLKGYTSKIIYDPNLGAIASSDSMHGVVKLSSYFSDYERLKKKYEYYLRTEFAPNGTTADSIIIHEMGHQLDGYLTHKGIYGGNIGKYGVTRTSEAVKREVLQRLGYYDYIRAERADWKRMGYKGQELSDAVDFSKKEFITKHISEYAYKNEREFFAECFSEYMTSKNPREAAKIFGEILEEIMEGL